MSSTNLEWEHGADPRQSVPNNKSLSNKSRPFEQVGNFCKFSSFSAALGSGRELTMGGIIVRASHKKDHYKNNDALQLVLLNILSVPTYFQVRLTTYARNKDVSAEVPLLFMKAKIFYKKYF